MAIGSYLVISLLAAAVEGLWLGCRDAWGENPVRGFRLERKLAKLDEETTELTRGMTEEEYYLSTEVEDMSRQHDQLMVELCLNKGIDPFSGGIARMYWEGRRRTQKRREELLHPRPPTDPQTLADELYARLRGQRSPAVSSAHTRAIGTSQRLALPPSS